MAELRGHHTGEGVYTTLLWGAGPPPTWPLHLQRLARDAAQVGLPPPPVDALAGEVQRQFPLPPAPGGPWRLRVRWWADGGDPLRQAPLRGRWELDAQPLDPARRPGAAVELFSVGPARFARRWAGAKVTAIGEDLAWRRWAQQRGGAAAEALLCSEAGLWSEAPTAALLVGLADGRVACPSEAAWPVRSTTLQALRLSELGAQIQPLALTAADLPRVRWLLLLNAVVGACPVMRLDGMPLAPAPPPWLDLALRLTAPPL